MMLSVIKLNLIWDEEETIKKKTNKISSKQNSLL